MNRPNPFDSNDGLGDGSVDVHPDGLVDKLYNLWNRNPMQVKGRLPDQRPARATFPSLPLLPAIDRNRSQAMKNHVLSAMVLLAAALCARADNPGAASGSTEVKLCDNKTTVQVPKNTPKTRAEGQKISDALMAQWKASNPNNDWVKAEVEAHQIVPPRGQIQS